MSDYNFKLRPGVQHHARIPGLFTAFAALYSTIPDSLKRKQQHFQMADGVPIYLKGGIMDRILFGATVGLIGFGLISYALTVYPMAYPKKKH